MVLTIKEYSKGYYTRYKNFDDARLSSFIVKTLRLSEISKGVDVTIDIGCGIGRLIYKLKDYSRITIGLDVSRDALEIAKKNNRGVFFILGNSLTLPIKDNICDVCLCIHVIEHIKKFDLLLREIQRIMAFNGKIIFITPNRRWARFSLPFLRDRTHLKEFTTGELKRLISPYFYIEDIKSFSMFTSLGIFNHILNILIKPDICVFAIKK